MRSFLRERPLTPEMIAVIPGRGTDPSVCADQREQIRVLEARYVDNLSEKEKGEFYSLSKTDQLTKLGTFMLELNGFDPSGDN